jgi:hypothetical protein
MSARGPRLFAALFLLAAAWAGAAAAAPSRSVTYRWVDDQGVVHYGDHVPPQYAQKEHTELNAQGVELHRLDAERTPEQQAADSRKEEAILRQKQHDSFLLTTYTSVADIEALRDERLQQLKARRVAAEAYVETLRSRLTALQSRALLFTPYNAKAGARRMPDDLTEDLVRTVNEMRSQNAAILVQSEAETSLRSEFQADIDRYRQLHTTPDR